MTENTNKEDNEELVFKFILLGDTGVGKSSIIVNYTEQTFRREHHVTIGVDFRCKTIKLGERESIKLQIWDTAGQETFGAIVRSFYKYGAAIFLVYSVKSRASFENLGNWLEEVKDNCNTDPVFILVGNQTDSDGERVVSYEEGLKFMQENNLNYFIETSACDGKNIKKAFLEATKLAYVNYVKETVTSIDPRIPHINLKGLRQRQKLMLNKTEKEKKMNSCCYLL